MCVKAMLRKILACLGCVSEAAFLLLSVSFYLPLIWYLDTGAAEYIGGMWTYCVKTSIKDYSCDEIDEDQA